MSNINVAISKTCKQRVITVEGEATKNLNTPCTSQISKRRTAWI